MRVSVFYSLEFYLPQYTPKFSNYICCILIKPLLRIGIHPTKHLTDLYGSRWSHTLDKPCVSKDIFLIYLLYQMIYPVHQISDIEIKKLYGLFL